MMVVVFYHQDRQNYNNNKLKRNRIMMKDTVQIITANAGAIGVSLSNVNDLLTFCSLSIAIIFTIYKYYKIKNK